MEIEEQGLKDEKQGLGKTVMKELFKELESQDNGTVVPYSGELCSHS